MTKILASALIVASALTLSVPAFAQRSASSQTASIFAANGDAAQRVFDERERSFSSSNQR